MADIRRNSTKKGRKSRSTATPSQPTSTSTSTASSRITPAARSRGAEIRLGKVLPVMSRGDEIRLSKLLSFTLRHGAAKQGIAMDTGGWVSVPTLLAHPDYRRVNASFEQVCFVVENNDKKRFAMQFRPSASRSPADCHIRANQGHSSEVPELELRRLTAEDLSKYPVVLHGTTERAYQMIRHSGLNRMARQHIHFAKGLPGTSGVISGVRYSVEVIIYMDLEAMLRDGIEVYESANGVILSPGVDGVIPPKYFQKVEKFGK